MEEQLKNGLSERYVDTNALFEYGFDNFEFTDFCKSNTIIKNIEIENATKETKSLNLITKDTLNTLVNKDLDISSLNPTITLNDKIIAPIAQGEKLGTLTYTIDSIDYTTDLIAEHEVIEAKYTEQIILGTAIFMFLVGILLLKKSGKPKKKKNKKNSKKKKDYLYYKSSL